jgi:hypothetical protein
MRFQTRVLGCEKQLALALGPWPCGTRHLAGVPCCIGFLAFPRSMQLSFFTPGGIHAHDSGIFRTEAEQGDKQNEGWARGNCKD